MRSIRNSGFIEPWVQAANPLDNYLEPFKNQQAWLPRPRRETCETLLQSTHWLIDTMSNGQLSQFELLAELSHEVVDAPRWISLMPERRISIVSHPICAAAFGLQAFSRSVIPVRPGFAMPPFLSQAALFGGVDIPGLIKEIRSRPGSTKAVRATMSPNDVAPAASAQPSPCLFTRAGSPRSAAPASKPAPHCGPP